MTQFFRVKNFDKFQHYRDRKPPWIKFYKDVFEDYEIARLPDATKAHLFAIWLLASCSSNRIPYDSGWVERRINATEIVDLKRLLEVGLIELIQEDSHASTTIASRKQNAPLDRDRDRKVPLAKAKGDQGKNEVKKNGLEPIDKKLYRRGKEVLGKSAGGQITTLLNAVGTYEEALALIEQADESKENAREWIAGVIKRHEQDSHRVRQPELSADVAARRAELKGLT